MTLKKLLVLLFVMVFPAIALANEPAPSMEEAVQQDDSVNVLEGTETGNEVVIVRGMTLREILIQRLRERHAMGLDMDISESFIENLSDAEIEEIFSRAEEEDFEADEIEEDDESEEAQDDKSEKAEDDVIDTFSDFVEENEGAIAGTVAAVSAAAVIGAVRKRDEDFEAEEDESEDEFGTDEYYEDMEDSFDDDGSSMFWGSGVAEAGALYGGGGGDIDTGVAIPQADEAWSYNNSKYKAQYVNTGNQVNDVANYMSDLASAAFGKNVPAWFWRVVIRCEVADGDVLGAHFNNPGGMDYEDWMERYCVGPVESQTFIDNGGETHEGAKFFSIWDGIMCEVAWFCRPDADSWWAEEIRAAANASNFEEAEHAIRLHVAHYNRGMELSAYNSNPEYGDTHFYDSNVPYYWVLKEEY